MANLSPQQEAINREHNRHQVQDHIFTNPSCPECKRICALPPSTWSTSKSSAYNAMHGTNFVNDAALNKFMSNEAELKRIENYYNAEST